LQESLLQNLSEVRASTVEKAALFLDAALSARSRDAQTGREAHLLYTLHVYQYSLNNDGGSSAAAGGVAGGRSRLHLLDLGGCDGGSGGSGNSVLTLSGLGNVLIGIFNGQKHLPCRHSKLTGLLRDCLGSLTCHATMLAHVSADPRRYAETLHTLQLAARIHRLRRKRRGSNSSGERRVRNSGSSGSDFTTSATSTDPSSSELSCSTVIYRGVGAGGLSEDGSGTDGEHPPPPMGSLLGCGASRRRRFGGSRILTNGTISPSSSRLTLTSGSSTEGLQSPRRGLTPTLPAIKEFNGQFNLLPLSPQTHHGQNVGSGGGGKMPLHGQVPGYRQPANEVWIDGQQQHRQQLQRAAGIRDQAMTHLHPSPPLLPTAHGITGLEAAYGGESSSIDSSAALRQYGYMDAFKASMICNWVETQADAKFLTQFKQAADSTSDSGSEHRLPVSTEVRADVHVQQQHLNSSSSEQDQLSPSPPPLPQLSPRGDEAQWDGGRKERSPPPPPPRRLSPVADQPASQSCTKSGGAPVPNEMLRTLMEVEEEEDREEEVEREEEVRVVEKEMEEQRVEGAASDTSMEPLPEPDFDALDSRFIQQGNFKNKTKHIFPVFVIHFPTCTMKNTV
jgi:hypothetical protein